jgi:hypothetical protein
MCMPPTSSSEARPCPLQWVSAAARREGAYFLRVYFLVCARCACCFFWGASSHMDVLLQVMVEAHCACCATTQPSLIPGEARGWFHGKTPALHAWPTSTPTCLS